MTTLSVIQAVESWAATVVPELSSYDSPPEELITSLPMVLAEVQHESVSDQANKTTPGVPQYQQTYLRVWEIDLILLTSPDPAWTASHALYDIVDALDLALRKGVVLDDNIVMAQFHTTSFDPPEVEYADGTVARQATFSVTVAQPIGA